MAKEIKHTTISWTEYADLMRDRDRLDLLDTVWRLATGQTARQQADKLGTFGAPEDYEGIIKDYRLVKRRLSKRADQDLEQEPLESPLSIDPL